jgi:hypothetical protein
MIQEAITFLRREINEKIDMQTNALVRGGVNRDEDQMLRGIIRGLNMALNDIADLEDRIKRANNDE